MNKQKTLLADERLKEIVARIKVEVSPDKIILFGSRAEGKNEEWSDYDICILKTKIKNRRKLAQKIYRRLFSVGASVDIIVETPERFRDLKDKWFLIHSKIARFGEVIYEK